MKRLVAVLALLTAAASPALAGGDWDDGDDVYYDGYYEHRHARGEYRPAYGDPYYRAPSHEVYIPYGYYFADEPHEYGSHCKIERKWKRGRYKEKIECDDDD